MESVIVAILVIIPGVWSGEWQVTFDSQCALNGASVVMKCSYDYPSFHIVTSVQWYKVVPGKWKFQIDHHSSRFQYLGNRNGDCTLKINTAQDADEGEYTFTFWTTLGSYASKSSAYLTIKGLTAVVNPATVTEGAEVRLDCVPGCPSPRPSVAWLRDGNPVRTSVFLAQTNDTGRYSCVVIGAENIRSASVALNVQYRPKKVALSQSPSAIIKGSSVRFACNSDANPAVTQSGYSLFKGRRFISSGQYHTISNIQPAHGGRYYCQAWNGIRLNGLSFSRSPEVNIEIKYHPENVSVSMDPVKVVEGGSVNLTCSSDAEPAAHSFTWYRRAAAPDDSSLMLVGSGQVLSLSSVGTPDTGHYMCQAGNPLGENNSTEVLLEMESGKGNLALILAGVGVTLLLAILVFLLWVWKSANEKRQKRADKQQTKLSERGSSSSAMEMQDESLYANVQVSSSSSRPPKAKRHAGQLNQAERDAIIYSTVMTKPRKKSPQHHTSNSQALQDSRPNSGDGGNNVIYATIQSS